VELNATLTGSVKVGSLSGGGASLAPGY